MLVFRLRAAGPLRRGAAAERYGMGHRPLVAWEQRRGSDGAQDGVGLCHTPPCSHPALARSLFPYVPTRESIVAKSPLTLARSPRAAPQQDALR